MSVYISFDTFHGLCKKKLTIEHDISDEKLFQKLQKISKAKENQHFCLFNSLNKKYNNDYLKLGTDQNIALNQRAECCFELITSQCYSRENKFIKNIADKFLFSFIDDNQKKESFIKNKNFDENLDVFLIHFLFFFSFLQDTQLMSSSLAMSIYEIKKLNICYKTTAILPEKFSDIVVSDHADKLYSSTLFMLFGTKPFKPEKYSEDYKAIYLYNMALIQYKFSYCIDHKNDLDFFYHSEKNELPTAPIGVEMFIFLTKLKMSDEYPLYCEKLGSIARKISFKIEEAKNENLKLSNQEYGDLIITHFEREKHSSKSKYINNMYNLNNEERTLSYLKTLYQELNRKLDPFRVIEHDFIKTDNNHLTIPDIANIIFFHEYSAQMICQSADKKLRAPKAPKAPKAYLLNDLYKTKDSRIKFHRAFLKKMYEKLDKDINSIHISENEA